MRITIIGKVGGMFPARDAARKVLFHLGLRVFIARGIRAGLPVISLAVL